MNMIIDLIVELVHAFKSLCNFCQLYVQCRSLDLKITTSPELIEYRRMASLSEYMLSFFIESTCTVWFCVIAGFKD